MGKNHTTSVKNRNNQDPDPMAEGIGLVATSGIDEDGGLKNKYRGGREPQKLNRKCKSTPASGRTNIDGKKERKTEAAKLPCRSNHLSRLAS